jgi:hypothetical protein
VFDKNVDQMDKLDILANNMKTLAPDDPLKQAEVERIRGDLQRVTEMGAENASDLVRATARSFAGNQDLMKSMEMYEKEQERQKMLQQIRLQGGTAYDFSGEYKGVHETPDWTPRVETANNILADAKNYLGKIREKFGDSGISFQNRTSPDGTTYTVAVTGEGHEVSQAMLKERVGTVIDEFMNSPTGGEQFTRWNIHNGADEEGARNAALNMLMTAGAEQVGKEFHNKYQVVDNDKAERAARAKEQAVNPLNYLPTKPHTYTEAYGIKTGKSGGFFSNAKDFIDRFSYKKDAELVKTVRTERPTGLSTGSGPVDTWQKTYTYDNNKIKDQTIEDVRRIVGMSNPKATSAELERIVDSYYNNTSNFIYEIPEIKEAITKYEEALTTSQPTAKIMRDNLNSTSKNANNEKFTPENAKKDIDQTFEQRIFMIVNKDGKVEDISEKIKEARISDKGFNYDAAGILDVDHPYSQTDPNAAGFDQSEMFAQPYMINATIDGKNYEVAVSRDLGQGVYGEYAGDKKFYEAAHKLHKATVPNMGAYVDVTDVFPQADGQVRARTYMQNGVRKYVIEAPTLYPDGKVRVVTTNASTHPATATDEFYRTLFGIKTGQIEPPIEK